VLRYNIAVIEFCVENTLRLLYFCISTTMTVTDSKMLATALARSLSTG